MLLWISATGLAGAGWFGWLIYRDYDWTAFSWRGVRFRADSRSVSQAQAHTSNQQIDNQLVDIADDDLLGQTNTRWDGIHDLTSLYEKAYIETGDQQNDALLFEPDRVQSGHTTHLKEPANEDFVVVEPSLAIEDGPQNLDFAPYADSSEDFVVAQPAQLEIGISPFLATTDEDFVVVTDSHQHEESGELPEVDLTDYVDSWTPIVPKIAALISHELWPQLRTYLESLPQFGDTNLERVVNAVAGDVGVDMANPGGVGEGHVEGFAFYASLFDEMVQEPELVDA